ncbi:MAG TPA: GreA/GreB family elongation factor [Longimicrobiales bacterium]|nr:GreA/GreB family elongation factor [Longimicrobiales bacterium]
MLDEIRDKIEGEIATLTRELNVQLPEVIRKAVELGDLRENADYKSALERQEFVRARIGHLSSRMSELSRIDLEAIPDDRVGFGSRVKVEDLEDGEVDEYVITAGDYIDLDAGQISMASPLGRGFMGATAGDEVSVELPAGPRRYRILELVTLPQMVE